MNSQVKTELIYFVSGLWCQTCATTVEKMAARCSGVKATSLNFATKILRVETEPQTSVEDVHDGFLERARGSGFYPTRLETGWIHSFESELASEMERRLRPVHSAIVFFLAMWSSMFAFASYLGELPDQQKYLLACLATVAGVPALLLGVQPFARAGLRALRSGGQLTLDLFITLGAASAGTLSLIHLYGSRPVTYVDSAAMILSILLFAKHIEARLSHSLSSRVLEAIKPLQNAVQVHRGGRWISKPVAQVRTDERVRVEPDQTIPLDGRLNTTKATVDRHLVTGECELHDLVEGDEILSGMVSHSAFEFTVTRPMGSRTIDSWAESALISPARDHAFSKLIEKVERRLVQAALGGALFVSATRLVNTGSPAEGLEGFFVGVLIFCPCLFAAVLPLAKQMASLHLRKQGILLYRPESLFDLLSLKNVYLDKTGTLETMSTFFEPLIESRDKLQVTHRILHTLRHHSSHPILQGVAPTIEDAGLTPSHIREVTGQGLVAEFPDLGKLTVGRSGFVLRETGGSPLDFRAPRHFPVVALNRTPVGLLIPKARFDESGHLFMRELVKEGLQVTILSGDPDPEASHRYNVESIRYFGNLSPAQKAARIWNPALFVGDGLNDTLALAQAQVSCRIGDRARDFVPVDLHIRGANLSSLILALRYSRKFSRVLKQTALLALIYNLTALSLAAFGIFSPLGAVIAMLLSFLCLLLSVSRLR